MSQIIHNRKGVEEYRRELRKTPTPFESLLWDQLRNSQLDGRKFRRQHSIGIYILDFYCPNVFVSKLTEVFIEQRKQWRMIKYVMRRSLNLT